MTLPTIDLKTASDAEINSAVAEYCAGYYWAEAGKSGMYFLRAPDANTVEWRRSDKPPEEWRRHWISLGVNYLHDADDVIALLNAGWYWVCDTGGRSKTGDGGKSFQIRFKKLGQPEVTATADTFARAACICLLRASGKCQVKE